MNTPFLLKPYAKDYLWGGNRLNDEFAKGIDITPLAETWECSTHPDGSSFVASGEHSGRRLIDVIRENPHYLGSRHEGEDELPIMIKFIDAKQDLSVQVHPTDEYAKIYENGQRGKTEMWYVLDAGKDSQLIYGLAHILEKNEIKKAINNGTIEKYLQKVPVKKDDVFFIKAGTIHAIGAGILVAEIQENSNLTYRMYDYNRIDKNGKPRKLQVEKALEVAELRPMSELKQPLRVLKYGQGVASELLSRCKYFEVYRMIINTERRQIVRYQADPVSFRVLLCINGCGTIRYEEKNGYERVMNIYKGDCIFVPADSVELTLHGQIQFLDVRG